MGFTTILLNLHHSLCPPPVVDSLLSLQKNNALYVEFGTEPFGHSDSKLIEGMKCIS